MSVPTDPDRYSDLKLKLSCPNCGSGGLIPWSQLDRGLLCRNCTSLFRVEPAGLVEYELPDHERISVEVRTSASSWRVHEAIIQRKISLRKWLRREAADLAASSTTRWFCAAALAALIYLAWGSFTAPPEPAPAFELPISEGRARLLAEALVRRDTALLIQMTEPSEHRALRIWLAHATDLPEPVSAEGELPRLELLKAAVVRTRGTNAKAHVRLRVHAKGAPLVIEQRWVERNRSWYFQPVRLRTLQSSLSQPAKKGPRPRI